MFILQNRFQTIAEEINKSHIFVPRGNYHLKKDENSTKRNTNLFKRKARNRRKQKWYVSLFLLNGFI